MTRVVFPGSPGAFSEDAARKYFGESALALPAQGFVKALAELREGADYCVLPVANTIAGPVTEALAAIAAASWAHAVGEVVISVRQFLLGVSGAQIGSIARVLSHPMALAQCGRFLREHPGMKPVPYDDTASAARTVGMAADPSAAAIASPRTAALYGLKVLLPDIQDVAKNETRFLVLRRRDRGRI